MLIQRFAIVSILGIAASAFGQLAITEVVSSGSTNLGSALVTQRSDWWELSNFGTNTIDLTGYRWNDNAGGLVGADPVPFQGLTIAPGESVLFVETVTGVTTNESDFRAWWGPALGAQVQIRFYTGNGLGSGGDGIRVWGPNATSDADVIDSVDFGTAARGQSYAYDTNTGQFSTFSTNGVNGAFKAAETDDVGSPGLNQGPVALAIAQQPVSLSVNPGDNAVFSVSTLGMPRPRFQWQYEGGNIPGATLSTYTVTNVQTSKTGAYSVVVFNGFDTLTSSNALLSLNAAPEPPSIQAPPVDQTIYVNQNATFNIVASGVPQPRYRWRLNGGNIVDATNSSYSILNATAGTNTYSVVVSNVLGSLTNSAVLTVTPRPNLVITEVQSAESTNGSASGHNDWWELSNLGSFVVDLFGYKMDDSSQLRAAAYTITNHILISPGESVVFVEGMSSNSFRRWWGAVNLKPDLQIIRYDGANLGLSSVGDAVVLWNPGAIDDSDYISAVPFAGATAGISFGYNSDTDTFGDNSILGDYGAFRSVESDDIGSPGYLRTPSEPRLLSLAPVGQSFELVWYGVSGRSCGVEYKDRLTDPAWTPLATLQSTGPITTATFSPGGSAPASRFFRLSIAP